MCASTFHHFMKILARSAIKYDSQAMNALQLGISNFTQIYMYFAPFIMLSNIGPVGYQNRLFSSHLQNPTLSSSQIGI